MHGGAGVIEDRGLEIGTVRFKVFFTALWEGGGSGGRGGVSGRERLERLGAGSGGEELGEEGEEAKVLGFIGEVDFGIGVLETRIVGVVGHCERGFRGGREGERKTEVDLLEEGVSSGSSCATLAGDRQNFCINFKPFPQVAITHSSSSRHSSLYHLE